MTTMQANHVTQVRQPANGTDQRRNVRPATVPPRVTRTNTMRLELNFGRGLFDDEPRTIRDDRHPEWYIG